jgi:hypothetical protein
MIKLKINKTLTTEKNTKIKTKRMDFEKPITMRVGYSFFGVGERNEGKKKRPSVISRLLLDDTRHLIRKRI